MQELWKALKLTPVVYVTRDIERALGLPLGTKNYYIITNDSPFAKPLAAKHRNILLIKNAEKLDTRELLEHAKTISFLKKIKNPVILVFKNTVHIEKICAGRGWQLLNPSAELASRVEEKISQLEWLGDLQKYLPPHQVMKCKQLKWEGKKFIVQFNRAHTGSGTILVESEKQIQELQKKFPDREVRVTEFIEGPAFTNNNVVWGKKILIGNINYQITGLAPFTDQPFATIGNDWALPNKILSTQQIKQFKQIVNDVGKKLAKDGWKGLFGIDTIVDEKTGKLYLIEINARQPASTTYESQLQKKETTFEAHLASLLAVKSKGHQLTKINDGAQIIQRVVSDKQTRADGKIVKKLQAVGFETIIYSNTDPGEDLLRIQSEKGIMEKHNRFNEQGDQVAAILQ